MLLTTRKKLENQNLQSRCWTGGDVVLGLAIIRRILGSELFSRAQTTNKMFWKNKKSKNGILVECVVDREICCCLLVL